jgi:hypothetical protein
LQAAFIAQIVVVFNVPSELSKGGALVEREREREREREKERERERERERARERERERERID